MSIQRLLTDAIDGVASAAACLVLRDGAVVADVCAGLDVADAPVDASTTFDLASLTKVATTAAVARTLASGRAHLDDLVSDALPGAWPGVTVRALLGHRAGLVAWAPWFDTTRTDPRTAGLWPGGVGGKDRSVAAALVRDAVLATPVDPRRGRTYSDAGFLGLGWWLAEVWQQPLEQVVHDTLDALGTDLRYRSVGAAPACALAPTGTHRPRSFAPGQEGTYAPAVLPHVAPGEVDDEHAWILGGVAGHAGLFGTAHATARLGEALRDELNGAGRVADPDTWAMFAALDRPDLSPVRALGLDVPSEVGSSVGERFGRGRRGARGHLGFTGTSLWLDLDRGLVVALLTNRVWRSRTDAAGIRALRRAVHEAAVDLTA